MGVALVSVWLVRAAVVLAVVVLGKAMAVYPRPTCLVLGHARPAGAQVVGAGLISPSATQQGTSQKRGHDPHHRHTTMHV